MSRAVVLLLCLALAGCAAEPDAAADAGGAAGSGIADRVEEFRDVPVEVDSASGAILGVVVDPSITPVAGATVFLKEGSLNRSATSDAQGRFGFSKVTPGVHFLVVSHPRYVTTQVSTEVEAGVEPQVQKVRIEPRFTQKPFTTQVKYTGFFQCSQAGASAFYSSSNCVDGLFGPSTPDEASNLTTQTREWHADVEAGWQQMVFEMTWTPTSQGTSEQMGMVVSTYKPEREGAHQFANVASANPLRIQLDVGVEHETAGSIDPTTVPEEGMTNMSFFVAVRCPEDAVVVLLCVPPGLALNQDFEVFLTQFHYGTPNAGWSVVNGDKAPF